jgi:hypothetical protein
MCASARTDLLAVGEGRVQPYRSTAFVDFRVNPELILDIVDHQLGPLGQRLRSL